MTTPIHKITKDIIIEKLEKLVRKLARGDNDRIKMDQLTGQVHHPTGNANQDVRIYHKINMYAATAGDDLLDALAEEIIALWDSK